MWEVQFECVWKVGTNCWVVQCVLGLTRQQAGVT